MPTTGVETSPPCVATAMPMIAARTAGHDAIAARTPAPEPSIQRIRDIGTRQHHRRAVRRASSLAQPARNDAPASPTRNDANAEERQLEHARRLLDVDARVDRLDDVRDLRERGRGSPRRRAAEPTISEP